MPRFYRVMTQDKDTLPFVGDTGRSLGVRPDHDIPIRNGFVSPGTGGMSVAPSISLLPLHRIPRCLKEKYRGATGSNRDSVWRFGSGDFVSSRIDCKLSFRTTSSIHGLVEPAETVTIEQYKDAIARTRDEWVLTS